MNLAHRSQYATYVVITIVKEKETRMGFRNLCWKFRGIVITMLIVMCTPVYAQCTFEPGWCDNTNGVKPGCGGPYPDAQSALQGFVAEQYLIEPNPNPNQCGYVSAKSYSIVRGGGEGQISVFDTGLTPLTSWLPSQYIIMHTDVYRRCEPRRTETHYYAFPQVISCAASNIRLSINGANEIRPLGTGDSTLTLTAKIDTSTVEKSAVTIDLVLEVQANSGGHEHHDASRPKGTLTAITGTTDANGEFKFAFKAPEVSGIHKIKATCTGCSNEATHEIQVKVTGLMQLTQDSSTPPRYTLRGQTSTHGSNHWFTNDARINLGAWIREMTKLGWKPIGINDGSLNWGGRFDVKGNWAGSHAEHRKGEEVDISFAVGASTDIIRRSYYQSCEAKSVTLPVTVLWHDIPVNQGGAYPPHFHMRLTGSYTQGANQGQAAPCSKDSDKRK